MSYFKCPDCNKEYHIFGDSQIEEIAKKHNIKFLEKLPIDHKIALAVDKGLIEFYDNSLFNNIAKILE